MFDFDDLKAKSLAYGYWAAADGREDSPSGDAAFKLLMSETENADFRKMFEEYYHIGHLEFRCLKDNDVALFTDAKYNRLKSLIEVTRNLGQMAAYSFICPDFATNDPRFQQLVENVDEKTWRDILTFEWSIGYDAGLDAISGDIVGFQTDQNFNDDIRAFQKIRALQKTKSHKSAKAKSGEIIKIHPESSSKDTL